MKPIKLAALSLIFCNQVQAASINEAIDLAKANNRSIKVEDYKLEATKNLKNEAVAEFLPTVKASGQYGQRKSSAAVSGGNLGYNSNKVEELSAEQPIFDGFGSVIKLDEAEYKINSASAQNRNKKQEISSKAAQAFADLYRYEQALAIQQESESIAVEIADLASKRKARKFIDKNDAIEFEYELAQVRAKLYEYETRLVQAKFVYRDLIGEVHSNLSLPQINREKFDEKTAVEKALINNENLKSYRFSHMAAKANYDIQKTEFSPKVSVVGSLSRQSNAVYLNGRDFQNRAVYLNVAVPIFQKGVEYSNLDKTKNEMSAAREEVEAIRSQLIKDVGQAINEFNLNLKISSSNQQLLSLAQERVAVLQKRVAAGVDDGIELLRAKIQLNEKRIALINSDADLTSSFYRIKYLLGEV